MAYRQTAPGHGREASPFLAGIACAVLAGILASSPAAAQSALSVPVSLSMAQAQRLALAQSRQLSAQDHAASAAREMAAAAGQLPDPVLRIGIDNLPVSGPGRFSLRDDAMTMRRIGVMQELTRSDKRHLRAERFEREAALALAEKSTAAAAIERATAVAWLERYYAEAMAGVIADQGEQAKLASAAAEAAYRAGSASQADVFAARGAVAAIDDRAAEAARRVRTAQTMLARWIGDAAGDALGALPAMDTIGLDPAALRTRLATRPEIAVLRRQEDIAATEASLAQANKKADWSVEVMVQQRASAFGDMVSVGLSVPLQWDQKRRQDRELAARRALLDKATAQREEALREQVAQVQSMIVEWQSGRERLGRYRDELLPLASQRSAAALAAYRGGKAPLVDVLGARRDEIDVRLKALELESGVARLWAQLNFVFPSDDPAGRGGQ